MKKQYTLPILGTVIKKEPLTGAHDNPLVVFPIKALPDYPTYIDTKISDKPIEHSFAYKVVSFDVDNGTCTIELDAPDTVHDWLTSKLPIIDDIVKASGLTLKRKDK